MANVKSQKLGVALVHDWLTNQGGGERVLWALHQAFPEAPIYTSVYRPEALPQFKDCDVRTSFLQKWPLAKSKHQLFPLLRTLAFESFDLSGYDVVISASAAEAKGVLTGPETWHMVYMFTPTRYYWSEATQYYRSPGFGILNPLIRIIMPSLLVRMRGWDFAAAQRADAVVGISQAVANRIRKYYRREAGVIYPPVTTANYRIVDRPRRGFLVVGRLVPYKRADLAVRACRELNVPLTVVGDGGELARLRRLSGPKTSFVTDASDEQIAKFYQSAKALIFPQEEDFGIVPLEAMASGTPVIAYGGGGALETVVDGQTGLFFPAQSVDSLVEAMKRFEKLTFDQAAIRRHAAKFDQALFIAAIKKFVQTSYQTHLDKVHQRGFGA